MISVSYILSLVVRSSILGGIVYAATSTIPSKPLAFRNKLIISVIVVAVYSVLDYVVNMLYGLKNITCDAVCGSGAPSTADLIAEVDEAIGVHPKLADIVEDDAPVSLAVEPTAAPQAPAPAVDVKDDEDEDEDEDENTKRLNVGLNDNQECEPEPVYLSEGFSNFSSF